LSAAITLGRRCPRRPSGSSGTTPPSGAGRWRIAPLRPHLLGYLGYHERTAAGFRRLEVPSGEVHVIVSFGPEVRVPAPVRSLVAAPHRRHMLLGVPMHELADGVTPIEEILGARG